MSITFTQLKIPQEDVDYIAVGKREYVLLKPYVAEWVKGGIKFRITVPRLLNTDFGTTPNGWWNDPEALAGFILHDWGYYQNTNQTDGKWYEWQNPATKEWEPMVADWKRSEWDKLMFLAHTHHKVKWHRRHIIYRTVRLAGYSYWKS